LAEIVAVKREQKQLRAFELRDSCSLPRRLE